MKKTQIFVLIFSVLAILGGMGCVSLSTMITPAAIDSRAVDYAAASGVADVNSFAGYGNLDKAIRLKKAVDDSHQYNQLELLQLIDSDNLQYGQIAETTGFNIQRGIAAEEQLFGPEGLLSMGLSLLGVGSLGGILGLMRKRPGDITPDELKQTISGTDAQLTEKEKQFAELVKGIQKFIDTTSGGTFADILKKQLDAAQSSDTKKAVATIKATL